MLSEVERGATLDQVLVAIDRSYAVSTDPQHVGSPVIEVTPDVVAAFRPGPSRE